MRSIPPPLKSKHVCNCLITNRMQQKSYCMISAASSEKIIQLLPYSFQRAFGAMSAM